jgi:hypothetical protein
VDASTVIPKGDGMMERKLASIQKILKIEPIEKADAIEKLTILGWEVVAKKNEFKVGELAIYIETDSILPPYVQYEFLRERKYRIRTIKLRGQISQGLVLPLSSLPARKGAYEEGENVTELLGITKYLSPTEQTELRLADEAITREKNRIKRFLMQNKWFRRLFSKKTDKGFPKFISKTDEDRIQLFPNICELEKGTIFSISEKLDGQSGTWFLVKEKGWFGTSKFRFGVCSRNLYLKTPTESSYWRVARKYNIEEVLKSLIGENSFVAIQGEIIGQGIQGNKYGLDGLDMYAFNLVFPFGRIPNEIASSILAKNHIRFVPILGNFVVLNSIPEMVEFSKGISQIANIQREGIVARNYEKKISFKVINPDFLLKYES